MKKIPHKIKITPKQSFEIVWVERFDDERTMGECRHEPNQIAIRVNMSHDDTVKTLIHEIIHAISDVNGIKISHTAIHQLDEAIYKFLTLNNLI